MGSNNVFHADWFENFGLNYLKKNHNLVNLTGTLIETNKKHNEQLIFLLQFSYKRRQH